MADLAITPFTSVDKESHEKAPAGNLPDWPETVLFSGPSGCGKTGSILNLVRACVDSWHPGGVSGPASRLGKLVILHLDGNTKEFDALRHAADSFEIIGHGDLVGGVDAVPKKSDFDGTRRNLVIVEELDIGQMPPKVASAITTLFRYLSSHANCAVFASYQGFFSVPKVIRDNTRAYVLFKFVNRAEWPLVARRVGLPPPALEELYEKHLYEKYDSLSVWLNRDVDSPFHLRLNLFGPIFRKES